MLKRNKKNFQKHLLPMERQKIINKIIDIVPQKALTKKNIKSKSWTRSNFHYQNQKDWQNLNKNHPKFQEVLVELKIFNVIITVHNFIRHTSQNITAKNVNYTYYGRICKKIVFFVKLYEICH